MQRSETRSGGGDWFFSDLASKSSEEVGKLGMLVGCLGVPHHVGQLLDLGHDRVSLTFESDRRQLIVSGSGVTRPQCSFRNRSRSTSSAKRRIVQAWVVPARRSVSQRWFPSSRKYLPS